MAQEIAVYRHKPTENDLTEITDFVHDCFFDIDEIRFDRTEKTLKIPFTREFYERREPLGQSFWAKAKIPSFRCYFNIFRVSTYEIDDSENVGNYDFESISFDEASNKISINTNITLKFEVFVEGFELSISCDEQPLNFRKSSLFGL